MRDYLYHYAVTIRTILAGWLSDLSMWVDVHGPIVPPSERGVR